MPIKKSTVDPTLEFRPVLEATDDLIRNLLDDNDNHLADAIFFSKLQELRREHKRSLKLMESLYKEKLLEKTAKRRSRSAHAGDVENLEIDQLDEKMARKFNALVITPGDNTDKKSDPTINKSRDQDLQWMSRRINEKSRDNIDNARDYHIIKDSDDADDEFIEFLNSETREIYLEARRRGEPPFRMSFSNRIDQNDQDDLESMAGSYISDSYFPQDYENLSLDEILKSARSGPSIHAEEKKGPWGLLKDSNSTKTWGENWKPGVTVPRPFFMTIREKIAPIRATYSQNFLNHLKKEQDEKEAEEKAKFENGFRAKRVPASTHLPLFEEMTKRNQERRQFVREFSKEMLKEKIKPFRGKNFSNQHKKRCCSLENLHFGSTDKIIAPADKVKFKANPAPLDILYGNMDEGIRRQERERKEQKLRRAEELLKNSKWPDNMQAINRSDIRQALQSRKRHLCIDNNLTFKPRVTGKMPDFAALHDEFQRALGNAKLKGTRVTIPEPFELRINSRQRKPHHHEEHKIAIKRHHNAKRSRSMMNLNEQSRKIPNEKIISRPNTAALLREAAAKRLLTELSDQNRNLHHQTEEEEEKMREKMRATLIDYDLMREAKERQRTEQRRMANESSQILYDQFKRGISEKISDRQSLLDRQNMLIAKQSIEKRYRKTLEAAGLKNASVASAISSIKKLLIEDKDAAAAVAAFVEKEESIRDDVDSKSSLSLESSSSKSSKSEKSSTEKSASSAGSGNKSDKTITVISKSSEQGSSEISVHEEVSSGRSQNDNHKIEEIDV